MAGVGEDMEEGEILEPYELSYPDLLWSSRFQDASSFSAPGDLKQCLSISRNVMEALGPMGPGLLCITGVPASIVIRRKLLPLARKLALLDPDKQKRILKEHHLGSDVPLKNPERDVSSFAMQFKDPPSSELAQGKPVYDETGFGIAAALELQDDDEFKNLGAAFKELGFCMKELGLLIARVCDREIGGGLLEESLVESCAAKGRLVHYHSAADKCALREAERRKRSGKQLSSKKRVQNAADEVMNFRNENVLRENHFNLWQQWHYDYGIFTVLTDPMFLSSCSSSPPAEDQCLQVNRCQECSFTSKHSYMQIYHPSRNKFYMVKTPPDSFIVQIGESADILSEGKLRSTLHCVCRPEKLEHISRETFVVFLQPKWSKIFSVSESTLERLQLDSRERQQTETNEVSKIDESHEEIQKIVPPLTSRLRDGMTFAEFSRETTKQYYGGSGLQSNR